METFRWLFIFILVIGLNPVLAQELFDQDDVLPLTISGSISALLKDRGEDPQYHDIQLSYTDASQAVRTISLRARVRGNFRRLKSNCDYPPIMLNFPDKLTEGTLFEGQGKLKLVMPCQGDKYVIREYLVYKLYNAITAKSFKARLVQVQFEDPALKAKDQEPFYGILLEEENEMANRNGMVVIEDRIIRPEQTYLDDFLNLAVFEFLIGNTDWSVQYRQNVKLMAKDSLSIPSPVPYDFDHAGIVGAPYAKPAPELLLSSTRERRYRGYCIQALNQFDPVLSRFNERKSALYEVYQTCPLLDEAYRRTTLKFLDEFYETINNPKKFKSAIQYPCNPEGTGNVVIKGLKQ